MAWLSLGGSRRGRGAVHKGPRPISGGQFAQLSDQGGTSVIRRTEHLGAAVAALWLVGCVVVDLAAGTDIVVISLLAVSPFIASVLLSPRWTAVFAAAATGVAVSAGAWNHIFGTANHVVRVLTVAIIGTGSVITAALRIRRERRLSQITAIADVAQRAVLPTVPPEVDGLRVATRYLSAVEEARIGGDLYDVMAADGAVRIIVGDVRGKGLEAVQVAALVIRAFRQAARQPNLIDVVWQINRSVQPALGDEDFVTACVVEVGRGDVVRYVNCGHHPPLVVTDGTSWWLDDDPAVTSGGLGLPLGLAEEFTVLGRSWPPGARLLLYTDGLVEARDRQGNYLSVDAMAATLRAGELDTALGRLVDLLLAHVGSHLGDDLALVLVERSDRDRGGPITPSAPFAPRTAG